MEPPERSAQVAATLMKMALSLLHQVGEPIAAERLQGAIDALMKPRGGAKKNVA